MEELIVLIINGIAWLFRDRTPSRSVTQRRPGQAPGWPAPGQQPARPLQQRGGQQQRPLSQARPPVPRQAVAPPVRRRPPARPGSVVAAVAAPIITTPRQLPPATPVGQPPAVAKAKVPAVTAGSSRVASIRRQLTPAALRQQIVLSEILRPPLALRDRE
jgi:hypothetical protein